MMALLIGGPHDGLMLTVDKGHSWLTDDGELRLPYGDDTLNDIDPTHFAIYSKVTTYGPDPDNRHVKGAYRFSRYWTRPEELT